MARGSSKRDSQAKTSVFDEEKDAGKDDGQEKSGKVCGPASQYQEPKNCGKASFDDYRVGIYSGSVEPTPVMFRHQPNDLGLRDIATGDISNMSSDGEKFQVESHEPNAGNNPRPNQSPVCHYATFVDAYDRRDKSDSDEVD